MEGNSNAPLHDDEVTTRISESLASQSPNPLWLRICKVQANLRDVNKMAYEPVLLSIGPYHHGKDHLKMMEDIKLRYLQSLLKRRNETNASRYVEAMREMEKKAYECYADHIELDKDGFVMMMVLDGCFIVELFIKHHKWMLQNRDDADDEDDPILGTDWMLRSIQRDLLLCENQLPYFVLLKLLEMVALPPEETRLRTLALAFIDNTFGGGHVTTLFKHFVEDNGHLLSLMYYNWCPSFSERVRPDRSIRMIETSKFKYFVARVCKETRMLETHKFKYSATELKEAGIKFKMVKTFTTKLNINFKNGVLEIPPLTVDHHTESLFRNLIAYEQQPKKFSFSYITDYIRFMDMLIDSSQDVEILRHCGIIQNGLGDDIAVCTMFNKLCENLVFGHQRSCYSKVLINMHKHYQKPWHAWMANLRHNYFNSPWALISVLAAAFAILLTATQTLYAIISYDCK